MIITALDFNKTEQALQLANKIDPALSRLKVGKELFTIAGPTLVEQLQNKGFDVFLDLKFHDIPNTVAGAVAAAASLGVWMVNVHAGGGPRMLDAARAAVPVVSGESDGTRLIAVTVLTSMDDNELRAVGIDCRAAAQVERLAKLTREHGLDGVVCSPMEAASIRRSLGDDFLLITPGVRPVTSNHTVAVTADDQRRVMTPAQAMLAGSSYLVIGRPITQAPDPLQALQNISDQLAAEVS